MVFHDAIFSHQVLRTWGQRSLAGAINDSGRKLLAQEVVEMKTAEPPSEKPKDQKGGVSANGKTSWNFKNLLFEFLFS